MIKNFHKVRPNLYRGGAPALTDVVNLKDYLNINKIISLDPQVGEHIQPICTKQDIEHIVIPWHAGKIETIKNLLKLNIRDLVDQDTPTFVHCLHGKDRTGMFIALCRCLLDGWNARDAIKEAKYLGFGTGLDYPVERFYTKLISRADKSPAKDVNDADIVSNMQEFTGQYRDYTLDNAERITWSPIGDSSMRKYPEAYVNKYFDESYPNRDNYGLPNIDYGDQETATNVIPDVGVYDQNTQITNIVGPSLVGSGFV